MIIGGINPGGIITVFRQISPLAAIVACTMRLSPSLPCAENAADATVDIVQNCTDNFLDLL